MPKNFLKQVDVRTILGISGIVLFITFVILGLTFVVTGPTKKKETPHSDTLQLSGFSITDFYLDEELTSFFEQKTYPIRDPSSRWNKKEVDTYFIPVHKILHEYFTKMNDNYIKEIFNNVD